MAGDDATQIPGLRQAHDVVNVDQLKVGLDKVASWANTKCASEVQLKASRTAMPPEPQGRRAEYTKLAPTKMETGKLRAVCNNMGIKAKATADRDELVEKLMASLRGTLPDSQYMAGRERAPVREEFPPMHQVRSAVRWWMVF